MGQLDTKLTKIRSHVLICTNQNPKTPQAAGLPDQPVVNAQQHLQQDIKTDREHIQNNN